MHWLFILLSAGALVLAFTTSSTAILGLSLLVSLVLFVIGLMGLLARRVGDRSRDERLMIDPVELRRMQEQAEARKQASSSKTPSST